jgi:hypothetical protein
VSFVDKLRRSTSYGRQVLIHIPHHVFSLLHNPNTMSLVLHPLQNAPILSHTAQSQTNSQPTQDDQGQDTPVPSPAPSDDIGRLARYLSSRDQHTGDLFNYEKDSVFDPYGDKFDAKLWISKFAQLDDWASVQERKSGISFKDLTVFGYGTDAGESSRSHS